MKRILIWSADTNIYIHVNFPLARMSSVEKKSAHVWLSKETDWVKQDNPKLLELCRKISILDGVKEITISAYQLTVNHLPAFSTNELIKESVSRLTLIYEITTPELEIRLGTIWDNADPVLTSDYLI